MPRKEELEKVKDKKTVQPSERHKYLETQGSKICHYHCNDLLEKEV